MLKLIKFFVAGLILFIGVNFAYAEIAAPSEPSSEVQTGLLAKDVVLGFQSELLQAMKQGKELGFSGRYKNLEAAILASHDLTKIARIVVGKEWKKLTLEQRETLVNDFTRLSISAYAFNFKAYSGELFEYVSEDKTARGGVIVHSIFVLPDDKDVKFDYMLKKKGDNWLIINVIANGVSDLALKRSEYTSILTNDGFDTLIAKINEKIDNYAK